MNDSNPSNLPHSIGIVGGGQLGRMMIYCTRKLGFRYTVLDPDPEAPARALADHFIQGSLQDPHALLRLMENSDIATYEIEHIHAGTLVQAEREGFRLYPSPLLLQTIQDKGLQKEVFHKAGIPVPRFFSPSALRPCAVPALPGETIEAGSIAETATRLGFSYPLVQKSRTGGYDGRGVRVLKSPQDPPLQAPSIFEEYVPFQKELAVIVARDKKGNTSSYPVVEMVFNPDHNICDTVAAPARITAEVAALAREVAIKAVEVLGGVGVFGVELFLTPEGKVLLNEVAPRPHNSGHYTIEACLTSQFEQHVRAITGLPLGSPELIRPAVMMNLLGEAGSSGTPVVRGMEEALSMGGVSLHLYGKRKVRPFRKMGHVTILGNTLEEAFEKAEKIRAILKVESL